MQCKPVTSFATKNASKKNDYSILDDEVSVQPLHGLGKGMAEETSLQAFPKNSH